MVTHMHRQAQLSSTLRQFLDTHPGKTLDRDGLALHYIDEGRGEPIVMVHGNPSWSILFRGLIDALRTDYRVVAPDHLGCGRSDKPDVSRYGYTLRDRIDDLERLLDHLKLDGGVTLIAHDWGGMIALGVAARRPERIGRLILANTAAFHKPAAKRMPRSIAICRDSPLGPLLVRGLNAFAIGTALIGCPGRGMSHDVRLAYLAPYDSWRNRLAILQFVRDIPLFPGDRSYPLVSWIESQLHLFRSTPMLLLWGLRDFVFDRCFLEEWIRRFPHAEVARYESAGHYVFEEEGPAIAERVRTFLRAHALSEEAGV